MSAWKQVDIFKEEAERLAAERAAKEWRAFAAIRAPSERPLLERCVRVRGCEGFPRLLKMERQCHFVPGKWRSLGEYKFGPRMEVLPWQSDGYALPVATMEMVLVERDRWLERGCPRVSRPTIITVTHPVWVGYGR